MKQSPLLLASQSPFRKKLMEQIGLQFIAEKPLMDEDQVRKTLTVALEDQPLELAKSKAASLSEKYPNHVIIGSDQSALFDGQALHKPKNKDEAFRQLKLLSGNSHRLLTAIAVWKQGEWYSHTAEAIMKMRPLTDEEVRNYIEKDTPVGCAGSYKIESLGPVLFESIATQDFYSIIGLPLLSLSQILRSLGISTI